MIETRVRPAGLGRRWDATKADSFFLIRLPGELTGSGGSVPYDASPSARAADLAPIHPGGTWFPGSAPQLTPDCWVWFGRAPEAPPGCFANSAANPTATQAG
nr:hypothetical protein KPHV_26310 [Kitasatospora purpeofusca]